MSFGKSTNINVEFNGKTIEQVSSYKYLGNIIGSVTSARGDIFRDNYEYLYNQGQKAIFAMKSKLRHMGPLPPRVMFYLFDSLVKPILLYGSDIWGHNCKAQQTMDKLFHWFLRCILHVKSTTSNIIVEGESGQMPPSVYAQINVMCYLERMQSMKSNSIAKQVYNELHRLHECGHITWVTRAYELAENYKIKIGNDENFETFKQNCKLVITNCYEKYPKIRTYNLHKIDFGLEPYLDHVHDIRFRKAITKLRASSHTLEIERGRYTNPKTPIHNRLCTVCLEVEDEIHFVVHCSLFNVLRNVFFSKVILFFPEFKYLDDKGKYVFLMSTRNEQLMAWFGKYIHELFLVRAEHLLRLNPNT